MKSIDITGKKYGKLTVLGFSHRENNHKKWKCICSCGNITYAHTSGLNSGHIISCGCRLEEWKHRKKTSHGMTNTRFYKIWNGIKMRCISKNSSIYKYYGGRGIIIDKRWLKFINFKEDMYEDYCNHVKEHGNKNTSIDRINNDGNYCLENCRWATNEIQANNTRTNKFLTFNNKTLTISQWSKKIGIGKESLRCRIKRGWDIEKSITTPIKGTII